MKSHKQIKLTQLQMKTRSKNAELRIYDIYKVTNKFQPLSLISNMQQFIKRHQRTKISPQLYGLIWSSECKFFKWIKHYMQVVNNFTYPCDCLKKTSQLWNTCFHIMHNTLNKTQSKYPISHGHNDSDTCREHTKNNVNAHYISTLCFESNT